MVRCTSKPNKAIPVPKDGPVLWFVKNESSLDSTRDLFGMAESLELLSLVAQNKSENKPTTSVQKSPSQRLWSTLMSTDQLREQLQALQAYRSTLLHHLNNCRGGKISDENELTGTYRLLLEWALCDDIPTSLRRAIHSNLDTLASSSSICVQEHAFIVREQVVSSVLLNEQQQHWTTNPLRILFETLNYEPMRDIIVQNIENGSMTLSLLAREGGALLPILDEHSYYNQAYRPSPQNMMSRHVLTAMEKCVEAATALKLFLTPILSTWDESSMNHLASQMESLHEFLWRSLTCRGMPPDDLNLIGVAHGQALLFRWRCTSEGHLSLCIESQAVEQVEAITKDDSLPPLTKLAAIQGITATLPNQVMVSQSPPIFSNSLAPYVLDQCRSATGAAVRLSALRGLHTLINRCRAFMSLLDEQGLSHVSVLAHNTLEVVLQAWESPPARQVASAIPGLFNSLIALMRSLSLKDDDPSVTSLTNLKGLVKRVLDLPPNQKGKYLALESLLPQVGARFLIAVAGDELVVTLITAITGRGHNAVAIADLLGKLLSLLREEMNEDAGIVTTHPLNTKERRKLEKKLAKEEYAQTFPVMQELSFLPEWVALWAPPLAHALVSGSASGRKQVAALCIPLLVTIVGGATHRLDAATAFALLLDEVQMHQNRGCSAGENIQPYAWKTETIFDQILWAKLEIAKKAWLQKVMKPSIGSQHLALAIAKYLPRDVLKSSLTHSSESIRLVAFASIECVVSTYDVSASPLQLLEEEIAYWRLALPYAFKSGGKEYNTELLRTLSSLLNRLSDVESESLEDRRNDLTLSVADGAKEVGTSLPILNSFVCDFLITELIVHQGAYPGTVADKEGFVLALFQCIIAFVSQDEVAPLTDRKETKVGRSPMRRLRSNEVSCMRQILISMVSTEVISSLFSLLNSMWDHTRAAAFTYLCQLVELAHVRDISVSSGYSSDECANFLQNRGIYLASSPRQREADTGARMLAFINTLFTSGEERHVHIEKLAAILSERLELMEDVLGINPASVTDSRQENGTQLPMAHGLIHALRLSVEIPFISLSESDSFYERISLICCRAIQISLAVVADLKEGATLNEDGMFEDELIDETATPKLSRAPLNVNTGAVGANAIFSSIQQTDENESIQRFAFQRVIMGSWLMTKEACAAMASIISCRQFHPSLRLVERAGSLLISTLTTLKHQGAAFAAHRALQEIVFFCFDTSFDNSFVHLPLLWAKRLMREISCTDKVRDSTLRRSTGYALAFLSIMRSEPPVAVAPKTLCPDIMAAIVQMSMPPEDELETCIDRLRLRPDSDGKVSFFHYRFAYTSQLAGSYKFDGVYEWRCRVHALNILRLAILDAPLVSDTLPYIGDAIMSSILGYTDSAWAVRNSATMVFAAAMLRVVDADKNATSSVSSTGGNAITATELFRSYPTLLRFLFSVMVEGVDDMRIAPGPASLNASSRFIHPPLYPILLLLSRLQSVAVSGGDASDLMDPFVPIVLQCLGHRHHKVRTVAARALANLSSGDSFRSSFSETLLNKCERMLSVAVHKQQDGWNMAHGALLGIQYLILKAPDPGTVLQNNDQLRVELYRCIETGGDKNWCPPSCASIALEILHGAAAKGNTEINFENEVARVSLKVVSELSAKSYYMVDASRIGEASLAAIAARGLCEHCFKKVWDPSIDYTEQNISLSKLSFLLENNIIDVRLEAAKAFKKDICKEIELFLTGKDLSRETKEDILLRIAQMLQKALLSELNRAEILDSEKYVIGKHPPTVRRLSRCLLECCYALRSLNYRLEANVAVCEKLSARHTWEIALTMIGIEDDSPETALDTDSHLSANSGNAIELMAFAVQAMCTSGKADANFSSNLRLFVQLLNRCNDMHASWKLRHSVVVAIETSQILVWDGFEDGLKATQLDLCNEVLVLLQDSDPDVRFVAGRAIMQMGLSENASISSPSHSVSSQLALERGYEAMKDRDMSSRLLAALVECCRSVDESLGCFEDEMWNSEEPDSPHKLLNLGTERKIFEEEAANSFGELLLANQLRVATLVKLSFPLDTIDEAQQEVLELCSGVLHRLHARELSRRENKRARDFAHESTRSNTLFPLIHSLIIGSIAVIYLGLDDCNNVREQAKSITELLELERESAVHPCVAQALQVLASTRFNDSKTQERLLQCCFLIPGCFLP